MMDGRCLTATRIRRRRAKSSGKRMCGGRNNKASLDKSATSSSSKITMVFGIAVVLAVAVTTTASSMLRDWVPSSVAVNAFVLPSSSRAISSGPTGHGAAELSIFQIRRHHRYLFGSSWTTRSSSATSTSKRRQHQRRDDSLDDDNREQTKRPGGWTIFGPWKFGKFIKAATPSLPTNKSRRHYSDLKMREAEELGGIARSERYSSR